MKLTSFLVGVGVGVTITMLFAPQSGDETREMLSERAEAGRQYAKDRVQKFRDRANDTVEQGKKAVGKQADAVAAAAQAAKDTYQRQVS